MDYEKLHKETLERLQQRVREGKMTEKVAKYICPDFVAESEDERIRRWLSDILDESNWRKDWPYTKQQVINYLEKQKLHLTVKGMRVYKICPHCKERMVRDDSKVYTSMPPQYGYNCPKCGNIEFDTVMYDSPEMEEQKPAENDEFGENLGFEKGMDAGIEYVLNHLELYGLCKPAEWSDADKAFLKVAIAICNIYSHKDIADWLKSLPERICHPIKSDNWKPSEEQMYSLGAVVKGVIEKGPGSIAYNLNKLYEELKKL